MFKIMVYLQHINEKGHRGRKFAFPDTNHRFRCQDDISGIIKDTKVGHMKLIREGLEELTEIIIICQKDEEGKYKDVTKKYLPTYIDKLEFWTGELKLPFEERRTINKQRETVTNYYRDNGVKQI